LVFSLSLPLLSWCVLDTVVHIPVASMSRLASRLTRPGAISVSGVSHPAPLSHTGPAPLRGKLLTDVGHRWVRLSPRGSARAVCCWLHDAWGLLAPNDLLSVSAVLPPSTQSCMRSVALGKAQSWTAPPTTRFGSRTRLT